MFPTMAQTVTIQSLRQQKDVMVSGTVGSVVGNSFTLSGGNRESLWMQDPIGTKKSTYPLVNS